MTARAAFAAMLDAIDRARACIFLEMYLFAADDTGREFRDRLAAAALRGVRVMVLVDAWGSWTTPEAFWAPLRPPGPRCASSTRSGAGSSRSATTASCSWWTTRWRGSAA